MSATTTPDLLAAAAVLPAADPQIRTLRRRIDPEAGRALEKLGHAIDYLTDEYVYAGGPLNGNNGQLQAVQMLMALNLEIYFSCPEQVSPLERFRGWLRPRAACTQTGPFSPKASGLPGLALRVKALSVRPEIPQMAPCSQGKEISRLSIVRRSG